ncbi:MAG TPA: Rho termination factor N-terminal domain-containing protein [Acidimicrobiia bacterium]|nr:Rho termination factor N-terminal domain-containing protein [Acidimicrobiia bacterium]
MADNAQGFGATSPTGSNDEEIRRLLDQVQQLMIDDGQDPATAEALTNYARPASPAIAGNLADLNRMGQVAVQGRIDTPAGQPDEEASSLEAAFKEPPAAANPATGLQTPMGQIDADGNPTGGTVGDDSGPDLSSMTKAQLEEEAGRRGVEVSSGMTKQEMIDAINAG